MMGFLLNNPYLAIAKWIAIAGAVWYIVHTWDKAQNYDVVKAQLDSELTCSVPSKCSVDTVTKANESIKAVQAAQDAAKQKYDRRQAQDKAKEQEAAQRNTDSLKQLQAQLAQANLKLKIQADHSPACEAWLVEKIACDIQ